MYILDVSSIEVGALLEISKGEDKGLWKLIKVERMTDGEEVTIHMEVDQDTNQPGDEKIVEYNLGNPREICIFSPWEEFSIDDAESWPPPRHMILGPEGEEIDYVSYNDSGGKHEPLLTYIVPEGSEGKELTEHNILEYEEIEHWEYCNEAEDKFLQILTKNKTVYMFIGYSTNVGFVKLI